MHRVGRTHHRGAGPVLRRFLARGVNGLAGTPDESKVTDPGAIAARSLWARPHLEARGKLPAPLDLRLVPAAVAWWFTCWCFSEAGAAPSLSACLWISGGAVGMVLAAMWWHFHRWSFVLRRASSSPQHSLFPAGSALAALALVGACVAVATWDCWAQNQKRSADPVYSLLTTGSFTPAQNVGEKINGQGWLRLDSYPAALPGFGSPSAGTNKAANNPQLRAGATLVAFERGGKKYPASLPVQLRMKPRPAKAGSFPAANTQDLADLQPGQVISGRVALQVVEGRPGFFLGAQNPFATARAAANGLSEIQASAREIRVVSGPALWRRPLNAWRSAILDTFPPTDSPAQALLVAITLGKKDALTRELRTDLQDASLSHLVAVSGMHLGIVLGLVLALTRRAPRRVQVAVSLGAVVVFVNLVDAGTSVYRAALMGVVSLTGLALGRESRPIPALCLATIVLLAHNPSYAYSWGFALSVGATLGIITLGAALGRYFSHFLPRMFALPLAVVLSAQLFCAPLLFAMNGSLPVWGVLTNLAVSPVVPVVCAGGLAVGLAAAAHVPAALLTPIVGIIKACAGWIIGVAHWAANSAGAQIPWLGGNSSGASGGGPGGWAGAIGLLALPLLGVCLWYLARRLSDWQGRRRGRSLKSSVPQPRRRRANHL